MRDACCVPRVACAFRSKGLCDVRTGSCLDEKLAFPRWLVWPLWPTDSACPETTNPKAPGCWLAGFLRWTRLWGPLYIVVLGVSLAQASKQAHSNNACRLRSPTLLIGHDARITGTGTGRVWDWVRNGERARSEYQYQYRQDRWVVGGVVLLTAYVVRIIISSRSPGWFTTEASLLDDPGMFYRTCTLVEAKVWVRR